MCYPLRCTLVEQGMLEDGGGGGEGHHSHLWNLITSSYQDFDPNFIKSEGIFRKREGGEGKENSGNAPLNFDKGMIQIKCWWSFFNPIYCISYSHNIHYLKNKPFPVCLKNFEHITFSKTTLVEYFLDSFVPSLHVLSMIPSQ